MEDKDSFNKLSIHKAFVQARLDKGYRYLDLTGLVLNRIGHLYEEMNVDPNGCNLRGRKDSRHPYAIRFSPEAIWLQYVPLDTLQYVVDTADEWISSIAKDLEIKNFQTLGMRSHYFVKSDNIVKSSTLLARKVSREILQAAIDDVEEERDVGFGYMVRVPIKKYIAVIRTQTVRILREAKTPDDYVSDGLLFDIDIYWRRKDNLIPKAETKGFLKSAAEYTNEYLEKIGFYLMEGVNDTNSAVK